MNITPVYKDCRPGILRAHFSLLCLVVATIVVCSSCSDEPSRLLEISGWPRRAAFSGDGKNLIVTYCKSYVKGEDTVVVYDVGSWKKRMSYTSTGLVYQGYGCADPDVIVHAERDDQEVENLVFRSVPTGDEIARVDVDFLPFLNSDSKGLYCDVEDNIVYMTAFKDKVTAFDGSTGEIIREYVAQDIVGNWTFKVQKEKDRLVLMDEYEESDLIWVYTLSTGELQGKVEAWPRPWYRGQWVVYTNFVDDDTLIYGIEGTKDGVTGAYLVIVDIPNRRISKVVYLGHYIIHGIHVMEPGASKILVVLQDYPDYCVSLWIVDIEKGYDELAYDLCQFGRAGNSPIPDLDRDLVISWSGDENDADLYSLLSFPDYGVIAEQSTRFMRTEARYSKRYKLLAMEVLAPTLFRKRFQSQI